MADRATDVALIRPPVDLPEHRMLIPDSEDWVACLPRDHRFASREHVQIAELLDGPIVCAPSTAGRWRDYWLAMDVREGRAPTIAAVAATYEAEMTFIARGTVFEIAEAMGIEAALRDVTVRSCTPPTSSSPSPRQAGSLRSPHSTVRRSATVHQDRLPWRCATDSGL